MNLKITDENIPGTTWSKEAAGYVSGREFIDKIFYITDGIMLSQIREITGVDGSTLQNWVKRGWVPNTVNKKYSRDHLGRILIINMLRDTLPLERIDFLLRYINGVLDNREDDIIPESELYGYICDILDHMIENDSCSDEQLKTVISECTAGYTERIPGATVRLRRALEIIIIAYYAALIQRQTSKLFASL